MAVVDMAPISGRIVAEIHRDLAGVDLAPAGETDIDEAREFAAALIGPRIVSSTALKRVHEQTRAGLFLAREEGRLTGVLAFVLLSRAGLEAVWAEAFDACDPASAHMIQAGQEPVALYGWGVAAATKASAVRLIEGANRMGAGAVAGLPYFARPTTEAGHRLMRERMGFVDCPGSTSGLVWLAPSLVEGAAA
jgi:hypothetical protein